MKIERLNLIKVTIPLLIMLLIILVYDVWCNDKLSLTQSYR